MKGVMFPRFWIEFISKNGLEGATVEVPEELDRSGLGVELKFLTSEQSVDEATNYWPGIGVAKDGYVPVGSCLCGSGDYYYIKTSDGAAGPLYRIYHDSVGEGGYDPDHAVAVVLQNYEELLGHVEDGQR
jgi:hypothetical protein